MDFVEIGHVIFNPDRVDFVVVAWRADADPALDEEEARVCMGGKYFTLSGKDVDRLRQLLDARPVVLE